MQKIMQRGIGALLACWLLCLTCGAWADTTILTDLFAGTGNTQITTHTSDSGHTWAYNPGYPSSVQVLSGDGRVLSQTGINMSYSSATIPAGAMFVQHTITATGASTADRTCIGLFCDQSASYEFFVGAGRVIIEKFTINGTTPDGVLAQTTHTTPAGGDTLVVRGEYYPNTGLLKMYINGALVLSATDPTPIQGAAHPGLFTIGSTQPGGSGTLPGYYASNLTAGVPVTALATSATAVLTSPTALTATALPTGGSTAYTYQWKQATTSGAEASVAGATSVTYSPTGLAQDTDYYLQVTVNDGTNAVTSSEVHVRTSHTAQTTYYVANGGSDAAAGTSATTAWQTIARVNQQVYGAGDKVFFNGGQTFAGTLALSPSTYLGALGSLNRLTIGSYNLPQRATIAPVAAKDGVDVTNVGGVMVRDLIFAPSAPVTAANVQVNPAVRTFGVFYQATLAGTYAYNACINCDISGFDNGAVVIGNAAGANYANTTFANDTIHDNPIIGLDIRNQENASASGNYSVNTLVTDCILHDSNAIQGAAGIIDAPGCLVIFSDQRNAILQRTVMYNCGARADNPAGPGCWVMVQSTGCVARYCVAYNCQTAQNDGVGLDIDQNCTNCTMEYCYAYGNYSGGLMVYLGSNNNIVRYNVSAYNGIGIRLESANTSVYNNLFISQGGPLIYVDNGTAAGSVIVNNSFVGSGHAAMYRWPTPADLRVYGNNYYSPDATETFVVGGTTYTSLAALRAGVSIYETLAGVLTGSEIAPGFASTAWQSAAQGLNGVAAVTAFDLSQTSPLLGAGLLTNQLLGALTPSRDFHGSAVAFPPAIGPTEYNAPVAGSASTILRPIGGGPVHKN